MSRVGKMPIAIPDGTTVTISGGQITVKGSLGTLSRDLSEHVKVKEENKNLLIEPANESREAQAMWGTTRALVNNMVEGVSKGFERRLTLVGVGYRAQVQGDTLNMSLGFSHPVSHTMPEGVKCETPSQTEIVLKGIDKQVVGQVAAEVRAYRSPEPYKGKGVRYADEVVKLKETKKK
ncbi:50S ribosomal protein L6 [Oxalobacter sp. OttesenSCG-928-P03]|nr:50S ribosomal protein L6 [Oxalobacter sp. OttesenSCG-928-P03]